MSTFTKILFTLCTGTLLMLAGCGGQQPAAPAAQSSAAPAAKAPAAEATKQENPAAPLVAATEQKPEEAAPTVKILEEKGKAAIVAFGTVYFDFDKYNIKPEFEKVIKQNADILKKAPTLKVVIEGHCDERGTTEYNLALGQRRASAVMQALQAQGVEKSQMKTISYGKERPVDLGHTEEAWAKNRRGVITDGTGR